MAVRLATGPVSWGVDFADAPNNPPWEVVLDGIAGTGLGALELGPVGYLPEIPQELTSALAAGGLRAVGSFVFEDFHDPSRLGHVERIAARACTFVAAAGGHVIVIIDRVSAVRAATAGRRSAARQLSPRTWEKMIGAMERVADVARSHALSPVFHPHAGSFVEFRGEIERLLDESSLGLCIDTGHLAVAGVDPAELIDSHAGRVGHVHLKDVDPNVLHRVRAERLDYWTAVAEGLFCPIGCGLVDFPRVLDRLLQHDYTGCATLEQDRVAGTGDPQADVRASIKRLLACAPGRSLQASGTTHDTL